MAISSVSVTIHCQRWSVKIYNSKLVLPLKIALFLSCLLLTTWCFRYGKPNYSKGEMMVWSLYAQFLAHLRWRLTKWAYRMGLEPASVHPSMRPHSQTWISPRPAGRLQSNFIWSITEVGGKAALCFGADQIRTLVSMATDSSHRVIIGKRASSRFLSCFWSDPFYTCR